MHDYLISSNSGDQAESATLRTVQQSKSDRNLLTRETAAEINRMQKWEDLPPLWLCTASKKKKKRLMTFFVYFFVVSSKFCVLPGNGHRSIKSEKMSIEGMTTLYEM